MGWILLIEDDVLFALTASRIYRRTGHDVVHVTHVSEAAHALTERDWDLVITDWDLPDGSGEDVLPMCRSIPVVVCTASTAFDEIQAKHTQHTCVRKTDTEGLRMAVLKAMK